MKILFLLERLKNNITFELPNFNKKLIWIILQLENKLSL